MVFVANGDCTCRFAVVFAALDDCTYRFVAVLWAPICDIVFKDAGVTISCRGVSLTGLGREYKWKMWTAMLFDTVCG